MNIMIVFFSLNPIHEMGINANTVCYVIENIAFTCCRNAVRNAGRYD